MPAKNTIKVYIENGYYHIYNRGIDKKTIFIEEKDYVTFLYYLKLYLSNPEDLKKESTHPRILYKIMNLNLSREIDLIAFSLMPNHFHLQVKQHPLDGIEKLMRRVLTSYAQYFNKKYDRRGPLFESTYKAILLENDAQHLYLSAYIHRNPMKLKSDKLNLVNFSSYPYYLGFRKASWVKPEEILSFFNNPKGTGEFNSLTYKDFVLDFRENPENILKELILEKE